MYPTVQLSPAATVVLGPGSGSGSMGEPRAMGLSLAPSAPFLQRLLALHPCHPFHDQLEQGNHRLVNPAWPPELTELGE